MKTKYLHAALLTLITPTSNYALGLGDMALHSYLNEPFYAEIELIDLDGLSLSSIKVALAAVEDYERAGLEQSYALSKLRFSIGKNEKGRPVIKIKSSQRMSEPYLDILVDLAWPDGQLYRDYTVLLDPPGYKLTTTMVSGSKISYRQGSGDKYNDQSAVADKEILSDVIHSPESVEKLREQSTYGPVKAGENVWQIAQRYKTPDVNLQQIALAIVGANPEAFVDGNMNGLKPGMKLTISATKQVMEIPALPAKQEVLAHEEAWKNKTAINHVLLPPYFGSEAQKEIAAANEISPENESEIPSITPVAKPLNTLEYTPSQPEVDEKSIMSNVMTATSLFVPEDPQEQKKSETLPPDAKLQINTSSTAPAPMSNDPIEKLRQLEKLNQELKSTLDKRNKDIDELRANLDVILKERQSVASQANAIPTNAEGSFSGWPLWLLLIVLAGGGGFAYWYFRMREQKEEQAQELEDSAVEDDLPLNEETRPLDENKEQDLSATEIEATTAQAEPPVEDTQSSTQTEKALEDDHDALEQTAQTGDSKPVADESIDPSVAEELADAMNMLEEDQGIKEDPKLEDLKEEIIDLDDAGEDLLNDKKASSEEGLELPKSDNDFKRPLSSLGEVEIDEVQPIDDALDADQGVNNAVPEFNVSEMESELNQDAVVSEAGETLDAQPSEDKTTEKDDHGLEFSSSLEEMTANKKDEEIKDDMASETDEQNDDEHLLDFESGLYKVADSDEKNTEKKKEEPEAQNPVIDLGLDFDLTADMSAPSEDAIEEDSGEKVKKARKTTKAKKTKKEIEDVPSDVEEGDMSDSSRTQGTKEAKDDRLANPLKSKEALNTLLALAKTYIGMDDLEAAKQSLQEVIDNGDDHQKAEAQKILDELDNQE